MINLFLKNNLFSLFGALPEKRGRLPPKVNNYKRLGYGIKTTIEGLQREIVNCFFQLSTIKRKLSTVFNLY